MKRDLYIVSQVIRTGEYPISFSLFPFLPLLLSISIIWRQMLPQGIAFLPATVSLELLHKCGRANSIPVYKGMNETKLFHLLRIDSQWPFLTSFVRILKTLVIFRFDCINKLYILLFSGMQVGVFETCLN